MDHPLQKRRMSLSPMPGPDRAAKEDTLAVLSGSKKVMSEVNYTQVSHTSKKRCSECVFYKDADEVRSICDKVVGLVEADAVCDLFKQRDYTQDTGDEGMNITIEIKTSGD